MRHRLLVETPDHHAVRLAQLQDALHQQPLTLDADSLLLFVARLACGDHAAPQQLLRDAATDTDAAVLAVAVGRWTAWTGEIRTADALRSRLVAAVAELTGTPREDDVLHAAACTNLERLATDLGDPQLSARARAAGRHAVSAVARQHDDITRLTARAFGIPPAHAGDSGDGDVARRPAGTGRDDVAFQLLHFIHETLGTEPDATRHRIRLQPRAEPLSIAELPIADSSLSIDVEVQGSVVTYRVDQQSGAIPLTLLLEPRLPALPRRAWVDEQPADLQPRPDPDGGFIIPVQLVLDAARTLTLETA